MNTIHTTKTSVILTRSRNGMQFETIAEFESDGTLTLLSENKDGFLSAHRDFAQAALGGKITRIGKETWINDNGILTAITVWETNDLVAA